MLITVEHNNNPTFQENREIGKWVGHAHVRFFKEHTASWIKHAGSLLSEMQVKDRREREKQESLQLVTQICHLRKQD